MAKCVGFFSSCQILLKTNITKGFDQMTFQEEHSGQVWVNLITGEIEEAMKKKQHSIMYLPDPLYDYPICGNLNIEEAYTIAYNHVKDLTENR